MTHSFNRVPIILPFDVRTLTNVSINVTTIFYGRKVTLNDEHTTFYYYYIYYGSLTINQLISERRSYIKISHLYSTSSTKRNIRPRFTECVDIALSLYDTIHIST